MKKIDDSSTFREGFYNSYDFDFDQYQIDAFDIIDQGSNVIVAAPTGAGKTIVAEYGIYSMLSKGLRVFYTTPIKALSNQKYRDLSAIYGTAKVGLLTGDVAINPGASIVVMTTEVLRNMIYTTKNFDDLGIVVLDEVHYLQNQSRGAVWEEVIIHIPRNVKLVCLSATVSNAQDLRAWVESVCGTTGISIETKRPISLQNFYMISQKNSNHTHMVKVNRGSKVNSEGFTFDVNFQNRSRSGKNRSKRKRWYSPRPLDVILELKNKDMLPAIYFIFSRAGCSDTVRNLLDSGIDLTNEYEKKQINDILDSKLLTLSEADKTTLGFDSFKAALISGVAPHHAGLIPLFKECVELCFSSGYLKVIFATETLALGINMPARTVVISKLTKFTGETHEFLTPGEFTQLTGRAGRRGIDSKGNSVILWSPFVEFSEVAELALSKSYILNSSFKPSYNMTANLILNYSHGEAEELLNQSFAQFQTNKRIELEKTHLVKLRKRKLKIEKKIQKDSSTSKKDLRRISKIDSQITSSERYFKRAANSLIVQFDHITQILVRRGYIEDWQLNRYGKSLTQFYHESDLLILECLHKGVLESLNPAELAGMLSIFCYQKRGQDDDYDLWFPSRKVEEKYVQAMSIYSELSQEEHAFGLNLTTEPDPGFISLAHAWVAGGDLEDVLDSEEGITAGDFVRTFKQISDLLRQVGQISNTGSSKQARIALDIAKRGLVDESSSFEPDPGEEL